VTAPAIRGEYLKVTSEMQEALVEAIAARTGIDVGQDMHPQVLAGAVTAHISGNGVWFDSRAWIVTALR
jgi:hypothetical protein